MTYYIEIAEKLEKSIAKIQKKDRERIINIVDSLSENPRPKGCKKLKGETLPSLYRLRSGNYRIIYSIQDEILLILVVAIGHKKNVYE